MGVADWSKDGRTLLVTALDPVSSLDLWALPASGDGTPIAVAKTPSEARDGQFSPDGHWVAYASNESGQMEIWVQRFPEPEERYQVLSAGGSQPRWRGDGAELYYLAPNGTLMATMFETEAKSGSPFGKSVALFPAHVVSAQGGFLRQQYAVTADGQRFLLNAVAEEAANAPITIIANWRGFTR